MNGVSFPTAAVGMDFSDDAQTRLKAKGRKNPLSGGTMEAIFLPQTDGSSSLWGCCLFRHVGELDAMG